MNIIVEIAVDTFEDADAAGRGGAHRIELCSHLDADGLSPSVELLQKVRSALSIPIHVMVRPRAGDFCYTEEEFQLMKAQIKEFRQHGANGIVTGILHHDRRVDKERSAELVRLSRPLGTTFHRAFDATPDPIEALDAIIGTGAERLLTSGQQKRALEGLTLIKQLTEQSKGRIAIMPGAGIDQINASTISKALASREIHIGKGAKSVNAEGIYSVDEMKLRGLLETLQKHHLET